jgi:hypothetical protein
MRAAKGNQGAGDSRPRSIRDAHYHGGHGHYHSGHGHHHGGRWSRSLLELWRRVVLAMDTPLAMFGFALLANADQGAVLRSGPFEVTFRHPGDANLVMELLEDDL